MKALKRETTIANRFPAALRLPSRAGVARSGGRSSFIFTFVHFLCASMSLWLIRRGPLCLSVSPVVNFAVGLRVPRGKAFDFLPLNPSPPFLQKRLRPFLLTRGSTKNPKQSGFQIKSWTQCLLPPFFTPLHSVLHRQRTVRDDLSRNRFRARNQLRRRRHFIHQP